MSKTIPLREIAHSRSGEKGNSSMISVIAYDMRDYELLCEQVTVDAVKTLYGPITKGKIQRYEAPLIGALNFVLDEVLEGGRSRTLAFEESGKALSSLMLTLPVKVPNDYVVSEHKLLNDANETSPELTKPIEKKIRLGSAAAWSRDRFEPALELVKKANVDYLCFDSMSEVTMSAAQIARSGASDSIGYDPYLVERMTPILAECKSKGVRIITNQGWLDPHGAACRVAELAVELGIPDLKIAAVEGGDLTDNIVDLDVRYVETGQPVSETRNSIVSAEVYLGCEGIVQALRDGADVVITTRIGDACLYLGPLAFEFGWSIDDFEKMARGMVIGHLMECGAQVSGGYFADPGYKDVPDLENLGNPIVEVTENSIVMSKLPGSGGLMSPATCKEQLLYEVGDPTRYFAPDCVVDLTRVAFTRRADNEVNVIIKDGVGVPKPPTLKALVGLREGYVTEEMVIFAGPGALKRAQMTQTVLEKRFAATELKADEIRFDYIGMNAVHREASPPVEYEPYEVVLRVAIKTRTFQEAEKLRREIDPLAVNGVSGTGKWATMSSGSRIQAVIGLNSVLVPREHIKVSVKLHQAGVEAHTA